MAAIFLSYARSDDEPFVARLYGDLVARGLDVWWDRQSMPGRALTFLQEIRDAIDQRDRLVLVAGPGALGSAYVEAEWRYALQVGKAISPLLRLSDYSALPQELRLLDARDFRRDEAYEKELDRLVEQLSEPVAPMGKLIGVPTLPPHFINRPDRLTALKDAVLADLHRPVLVTGTTARTGIQGMGGIGKSVLATAMTRDHEVRRAFPDGVFWVDLGHQPNLLDLQRRVAQELGDEGHFESVSQGKNVLAALLETRAVMLVLDDLWESTHADAFDVLGPRCRAVMTTRDASLITALGGTQYQVQLLTTDESISLLAAWAEQIPASLPPAAHEVVQQCGRLPLAISLCGALARDGVTWAEIVDAMREADLEFLDHPHGSVLKSIKVSVDRLDPGQAMRFAELSAFPPDEATPEAAVQTLWAHTGGLAGRHTGRLLAMLERRSLLRIDTGPAANGAPPARRISLHDLLHDYAARLAGDPGKLHETVLKAYEQCCHCGWSSGPDDGYFFQHLRYHLPLAGRPMELVSLALDGAWLDAKGRRGLAFDLLVDLSEGQRVCPANHPRRHLLPLLERALRRDLPFVTRHWREYPQALFQSLWNACWWYDSPDTSRFYLEVPEGVVQPWNSPCEKLADLAASWPRPVDNEGRPLRWLRSLRPPLVPLDTPLVATLRGSGEAIAALASAETSGVLLVGDAGGVVQMWELQTQKMLWELRDHQAAIQHMSLHARAEKLGSIDTSGLLCVYESFSEPKRILVARNTQPQRSAITFWFDGHDELRTCMLKDRSQSELCVLAAEGSRAVLFRYGKPVVLDLEGSEPSEWEYPLACHELGLAALSADGRSVAVTNGTEVWAWQLGDTPMDIHLPDATHPLALCVSADSMHVYVAREDGTVIILNMLDGTVVGGLPGTPSPPTCIALTSTEDQIITGHTNGTVCVWSMREAMGFLRFAQGTPRTSAVWFPRGGDVYFKERTADRQVSVEDIDGTSVLVLSPQGEDRVVSSCVVGNRLAVHWRSGRVEIWEVTQQVRIAILENPPRTVSALAIQPRGDRVYVGYVDGRIRAWDIASGRAVAEIQGHGGGVSSLAFSCDGAVLVSGSWDHHVGVWEAEDLRRRFDFVGHSDVVTTVAVSPGAAMAASGSWDRTVRLWDTVSGEMGGILMGHKSDIMRVEFSSHGQQLFSESNDQTVVVWDVATQKPTTSMDQCEGASTAQMASGSGAVAVTRNGELAVVDPRTQKILAWYPTRVSAVVKHSSRDVWVGVGNPATGEIIALAMEPAEK